MARKFKHDEIEQIKAIVREEINGTLKKRSKGRIVEKADKKDK